MLPYTVLSKYYDRLMSDYDYKEVLSYISKHCKGKGLDIGAGTGYFAIALSEKGCKMTALDNSVQMLNIIAESARKRGQIINLVNDSIEDAELNEGYDFIIAMCDVFNYITNKHTLAKVFDKLKKALKVGGILIFDISTPYKLLNYTSDNQFFEDLDDITYLWDNHTEDNLLISDLTFFVLEQNKYLRYDEQHIQCAYSSPEIRELLEESHFESIELVSENWQPIMPTTMRYFITATRGE